MVRKLLRGLLLQVLFSCVRNVDIHAVPDELLQYGATLSYDAKHCPNAGSRGGVESDFANHPHLKLLAYELYDKRSWSALRGLRKCLESTTVKGCSKNVWQGQESAYRTLEQSRAPTSDNNVTTWPKQAEYIEYYLMPAKDTVLATAKEETAPMSAVSENYILQQPCNSLSNAGFYEIALDLCASKTFPDLPDWEWKDEAIAAAAGMAFGSFAMHSGSNGGSVPGGWYTTGAHDVISINQMFYLVHQGLVRNLAVTTANIGAVLNLGSYPDAIDSAQAWAKLMESDGEYWNAQQDNVMKSTPPFTLSVVGIILVFVRSVLHPELFGTAADDIYEVFCSALVDMLLPNPEESKKMACLKASPFATAILQTQWKVCKDIGVGLGFLGELMELFVEAFYWQETKAQPANYLTPWRQNKTITETSLICWQTPHANWHRVAAQLIRGLFKLLIEQLPVMTWTPPLTQEQKSQAWKDPLSAASKFVYTLRTKVVMSEANTINLCTIFARTALGAHQLGGLPLDPPRNLVDEKELNEFLMSTLESLDPFRDVANGTESFNALDCPYDLKYNIDAIHGLSCLRPKIDIQDFKYDEEADANGALSPSIKVNISFNLPATEIMGKATLNVTRKKKCGLWGKKDHPGDAQVKAKVGVDMQVQVILDLGKIFSSISEAVTVTVPKLELDCQKIQISYINLDNFFGEDVIVGVVNLAVSIATEFGLCDKVEEMIVQEVKKVVDEQITKASQAMPTSARRLSDQGRKLFDQGRSLFDHGAAMFENLTRNIKRSQKTRGRILQHDLGDQIRNHAGEDTRSILDKEWYCSDTNLLAMGVSGASLQNLHLVIPFVLSVAAM